MEKNQTKKEGIAVNGREIYPVVCLLLFVRIKGSKQYKYCLFSQQWVNA